MIDENFDLSPEENEKWFKEKILPRFADVTLPSRKPMFVLLTGQSGAGKTTLSHRYAQDMDRYPILFGADDLRALHPRASEILEKDERNYPFHTKRDSGIWREKLVDFAIQNKRNILVESILSNPQDWNMPTLQKVRSAGLRVECAALAVHNFLSLLGIFKRYEDQKKATGRGFPPTVKPHDDSYNLLGYICSKMILNNTVDNLRIYTRNIQCFYDSDRDPHNQLVIMDAINRARDTALDRTTLYGICIGWQRVFEMMAERSASKDEKKEVAFYYTNFAKQSGLYLDSNIQSAYGHHYINNGWRLLPNRDGRQRE